MINRMRAYVGTSGWNYSHWHRRFYPESLQQGEWPQHYAGHFDSVEVNNTFYRVPEGESVAGWSGQARSGFRFAVKMWRGVSHFKKLKDSQDHLRKFFSSVAMLPTSQRGPVLVQLPSNQGRDTDKLGAFLADFKAAIHPARWKIALEFRNRQWLCPEVHELLSRKRAAICLHDMPPAEVATPNDASFVYIRRHGPGGDYRGSYSDGAVLEDARRIRHWLDEGRMIFVYYNNDAEACAVRDAQRLQAALGDGD